MRKIVLTMLASAALAFGVAGQASARDYHGNGGRHYERHQGYYGQHNNDRYNGSYRHNRPQNHYRPYYSGYYNPYPYYAPPPAYYGGRGYGVGYSQPGFGIYIGR